MKKCKTKKCAVPKPLDGPERGLLPDEAFALSEQRKYPIFKVTRGCLIGSPSHATAAKGRARQQFNLGNLSQAQLRRINQRADAVIRACRASRSRGRRRAPGLHSTKVTPELRAALKEI